MDTKATETLFEEQFDRLGCDNEVCVSVTWRATTIWDDHERIEVHTEPCLTALKSLVDNSAEAYEGYQDFWATLADHEI